MFLDEIRNLERPVVHYNISYSSVLCVYDFPWIIVP